MTGAKRENTARERNVSHLGYFLYLQRSMWVDGFFLKRNMLIWPCIFCAVSLGNYALQRIRHNAILLYTLALKNRWWHWQHLQACTQFCPWGRNFPRRRKGKKSHLNPCPEENGHPTNESPHFSANARWQKKEGKPSGRERDYLFLLLCQIGAPFIPPFVHGTTEGGRKGHCCRLTNQPPLPLFFPLLTRKSVSSPQSVPRGGSKKDGNSPTIQ